MLKISFTAHCADPVDTAKRLDGLGTRVERTPENESYFEVPASELRPYDHQQTDLIGHYRTYEETDSPQLAFESSSGSGLHFVSREDAYQGDRWVASLDRVDGYLFIRVEVKTLAGDPQGIETIEKLRTSLGVGYLDIIPWSYRQVRNIIEQAASWRNQLGGLEGRLFLIDGPSAAGKSTLARALREEGVPGYVYIPRRSSRAHRADDISTDEYLPVSIHDFRKLAVEGRFLEYREFKFEMGYGLLWPDVAKTLSSNGTKAGYALVNLGNSRHIQRFVPDATTILVTAPIDQTARPDEGSWGTRSRGH